MDSRNIAFDDANAGGVLSAVPIQSHFNTAWALWDVVHPYPPLDQRARYPALGEIDGKPDAHRAGPDNDDLISLAHTNS